MRRDLCIRQERAQLSRCVHNLVEVASCTAREAVSEHYMRNPVRLHPLFDPTSSLDLVSYHSKRVTYTSS